MEIIVFLSIVIAVVAVLTSIVLVRRVKKQIAEMTDVLVDVKNGNGNRRILSLSLIHISQRMASRRMRAVFLFLRFIEGVSLSY